MVPRSNKNQPEMSLEKPWYVIRSPGFTFVLLYEITTENLAMPVRDSEAFSWIKTRSHKFVCIP